jgi:hypothetical protein
MAPRSSRMGEAASRTTISSRGTFLLKLVNLERIIGFFVKELQRISMVKIDSMLNSWMLFYFFVCLQGLMAVFSLYAARYARCGIKILCNMCKVLQLNIRLCNFPFLKPKLG